MYGHLRSEGRDLFGKLLPGPLSQTIRPLAQHLRGRALQAPHFLLAEILSPSQGRQPRAVEDLVGVGVADAAEQPRVGQRALERVAPACQHPGEGLPVAVQHLESSGVVLC